MKRKIELKITEELHSQLKARAKNDGLSIHDYVISAVNFKIKEQLSLYSARSKKEHSTARFNFIDLFAGIGGMRIAFEAVGGECVYSSEWDKYSQATYFSNFWENPSGDITKVQEKEIPDHDILVAGFPCQPFSIAGVSKKNSLGRAHGFLDQTQGTLFFDVARIIKKKRPKAFLLENVKNLTSHDKGKTFKVICETLDQLGYTIYPRVVDGKPYVPQHREL